MLIWFYWTFAGALVATLACVLARRRPPKETRTARPRKRRWLSSALVSRICLVLATFLTCVGAAMFIVYRWQTFSPIGKLAILAPLTALFYIAGGLLLRKLRPGGIALLVVGCLLTGFDLAAFRAFGGTQLDWAIYRVLLFVCLAAIYAPVALWSRSWLVAFLSLAAAGGAVLSTLIAAHLDPRLYAPIVLATSVGELALLSRLSHKIRSFHQGGRLFLHIQVAGALLWAGGLAGLELAAGFKVHAPSLPFNRCLSPLWCLAASLFLAATFYALEEKRSRWPGWPWMATAMLGGGFLALISATPLTSPAWEAAVFATGLVALALSCRSSSYRLPTQVSGYILLAVATAVASFSTAAVATSFLFLASGTCLGWGGFTARKAWLYISLGLAGLAIWRALAEMPFARPYAFTLAAAGLVMVAWMRKSDHKANQQPGHLFSNAAIAALATSSLLALTMENYDVACIQVANAVLFAGLASLRGRGWLYASCTLAGMGIAALESLCGLTTAQMGLTLTELGALYWLAGKYSRIAPMVGSGLIVTPLGAMLTALGDQAGCLGVTALLLATAVYTAQATWKKNRVDALLASLFLYAAILLALINAGIVERHAYRLTTAAWLLALRASQRIDGWWKLPSPADQYAAVATGAGAMALAFSSALARSLSPQGAPYALLLALEGLAAMAYGARQRLLSFFLGGAMALALDGFVQLWFWLYPIPGWATTSTIGLLLLLAGLLGLAGRENLERWGQQLRGELKNWNI